MSSAIRNQYAPDDVSAPGETLLEVLAGRGMSQAELAERTGRPVKTINEIVKAKTAITPETALQFEMVLGVPASFWTSREQQFRESIARQRETESLLAQVRWIENFPYEAMMKLEWIPKASEPIKILHCLLMFFGVASPSICDDVWSQCGVAFRQSQTFESSKGALIAWLRRGELQAQTIPCAEYNEPRFRSALQSIRIMTRELSEDFADNVVKGCCEAGVRVAFVPELPGTHAWGATRWLTASSALIQLSLRYKTDDHLWFTFFHEAGHILLHGKRDCFVEDGQNPSSKREAEANSFASDWLIPEREYIRFVARSRFTCAAISEFASELRIAPGIVVGRLQHDGHLRHNQCYHLKKRLGWAE